MSDGSRAAKVSGVVVDWGRSLRLLATCGAAWVPAMLGLCLLGFGVIPFPHSVGLGVAGVLVSAAVIGTRTIKRRWRPLSLTPGTGSADPPAWRVLANPRNNHAVRWAMYQDLSAWLVKRNWSGKVVAEFGGTNEVLRAFARGAEYKLLWYPEYDVEHLHRIADNTFDLAILDQTLEHLREPERALAEVRRVLKSGGMAIVTTPFLIPVHPGNGYGDYYRWTPDGLALVLQRAGFDAEVRMWGSRRAAAVLLEDMYMSAETAFRRGMALAPEESESEFPVTVWAVATARKD
jgi:SAM-dependent methyltransferase